MSTKNLVKRTWVYSQHPVDYGISCDKCKGSNITWSEFAHHIWCYDCLIDTKGTKGVFGGPIQPQVAKMVGIEFNRIMLETNELQKYDLKLNKFVRPDGSVDEYEGF